MSLVTEGRKIETEGDGMVTEVFYINIYIIIIYIFLYTYVTLRHHLCFLCVFRVYGTFGTPPIYRG